MERADRAAEGAADWYSGERGLSLGDWQIHYLNANGQLDGLVESIAGSIDRARERAEKVTPPISIDVVVQAWPNAVIPERGHVGRTPTGTMIYLTFDPANKNLKDNLCEPLERVVVHELHHVLRNRGPGYGATLGEALVSEGLAGQFAKQLYQSEAEPWEQPPELEVLAGIAKSAAEDWEDTDYDHERWFFGTHDLPHWAGYQLGYALVGRYLVENPDETPASLAETPAAAFLPSLVRVA